MKRLSDQVREARKSAGLKQAELGARCGVTASAICAIEKGRNFPSEELMTKLCYALKLKADELEKAWLEEATQPANEEERMLVLAFRRHDVKTITRIIHREFRYSV